MMPKQTSEEGWDDSIIYSFRERATKILDP